jgi:hypothetical protein
MKITKVELDDFEREMIIAALEKLANDADKISLAAQRMNMEKAAKEASTFKLKIKELQDKVVGKQKLV